MAHSTTDPQWLGCWRTIYATATGGAMAFIRGNEPGGGAAAAAHRPAVRRAIAKAVTR